MGGTTISTIVGAVLAILAAIGSNLGVNVQKKAHMINESKPEAERTPYVTQPLWWLGMILVVSGSVGDLLALGFAPQTLVASLGGGSTIFANVFFAHWWLKQPLYKTDIQGVVFVTIGVILCAAASQTEGTFTAKELWNLWLNLPFVLYLIIIIGFVFMLSVRIRMVTLTKERTEASRAVEATRLPVSSKGNDDHFEDVDLSSSGLTKKSPVKELKIEPQHGLWLKFDELVDHILKKQPRTDEKQYQEERRLALYYAALSGTLGAQSVLLAKCVMELIVTSIHGENQFRYIGTYIFLVGCICCLLTQTHTLNLSTMHGDTMSTFPVFQAFWIGVSNINAIVYFQQASSFSTMQWILFPSALTVAIYGIYLISLHEQMSEGQSGGAMYSVVVESSVMEYGQLNASGSSAHVIAHVIEDEDETMRPVTVTGTIPQPDLSAFDLAVDDVDTKLAPRPKKGSQSSTNDPSVDAEIDSILNNLDPESPRKGKTKIKFENEGDIADLIAEALNEKPKSASVSPFPAIPPPISANGTRKSLLNMRNQTSSPQQAPSKSSAAQFVIDGDEANFV